MAHILIIEDEPDLIDTWTYYLEQAGHKITATTEGDAGLDIARNLALDLILLDLRLSADRGSPYANGMEILRQVRSRADMPIIVLTGNYTDPVDRVLGFQQGADDYLIKGHFGVQELLARVEYQLSRGPRGAAGRAASEPGSRLLHSANLVLDRDRQVATLNGRPLDLAPLEFKLLVFFLLRRGRNVSYEDIWRHGWNDAAAEPLTIRNNVRIHVSSLRRKLGPLASREPRIISIRGVGYCFRE